MRKLRLLSFLTILALLALSAPAVNAAGGKGRYIVVFKDSVARPKAVANKQAKKHDANVGYVYTKAIKGYSAKLKAKDVAALRADPQVASVVADGIVTIAGKSKNSGRKSKSPKSTPPPTNTTPPPSCNTASNSWGRDRIDQRDLPLSNTYCTSNGGSGVTAYIIDTGIDLTHTEFGGRAVSLFDAVDGGAADDCNGHGTHVAGTVGGANYGVASQVKLEAVRVLDCNGYGYWSGVIAGINAVVADHDASGGPAVANMSLGGGANSAVDQAVANAIADGITFAIAAGNSNRNACNFSPARVGPALTVGATTSSDARASYSNYGSCVDLFAPGSSIKSAWNTSNTATRTLSGTSMATPHVTGVAAQYLSDHPGASPSAVANAIVSAATANHVSGISRKVYKGTPNELLFTPAG